MRACFMLAKVSTPSSSIRERERGKEREGGKERERERERKGERERQSTNF